MLALLEGIALHSNTKGGLETIDRPVDATVTVGFGKDIPDGFYRCPLSFLLLPNGLGLVVP
jgi:hypothetical protein